MGKRESGQQIIQSVLQLIPEAQRSLVEGALNEASTQAAVADLLGEGVLRQSDYSRQLDEARRVKQEAEVWHRNLESWYGEQKSKLAEYDALKAAAEGGNGGHVPPAEPKLPDNLLTTDDFRKQLASRDAEWAGFLAVHNQLSFKHFQQFGEPLDVAAVMKEAQQHGVAFDQAYSRVYSEKIQAFEHQKAQQGEAELRKKIEAEVRQQFAAKPPYPTPHASPGASPIDHLAHGAQPNGTPADFSVDRAVAEYQALVAARMAGGGSPSA